MNPRMQHAICGLALLTLAATCGIGSSPARADALQGFSLGGGVGRYNIAINNFTQFGNTITGYSTTDTAYQFFGKWRFNPYVALEGQYMNLGTGTSFAGPGVELRTHTSGWAPWIVGTLPLGSPTHSVVGPVELFAKAGGFFYQFHTDYITPVGTTLTHGNTYSQFVWGLGLGMVFIQRLDVRLEYDMLHLQNTDRSHALWLTAAFNF